MSASMYPEDACYVAALVTDISLSPCPRDKKDPACPLCSTRLPAYDHCAQYVL